MISSSYSQPLVTIFIPTVGRTKYIKEAIKSAQNQTYKNIEILIGDNASNDGTQELLKQETAFDSRIRSYRFNERVSITNNWQKGIDSSKGDYLTILCDDDKLKPDAIQACIDIFAKNPELHAVAGLDEMVDSNLNILPYSEKRQQQCLSGGVGLKQVSISTFQGYSPLFISCLVKTTWAKQIGFKTYSNLALDLDFFWRASVIGYNYFFLDKVLSIYRIHDENISSTQKIRYSNDWLNCLKQIELSSPSIYLYPGWRKLLQDILYSIISFYIEDNKFEEAKKYLKNYQHKIDNSTYVKSYLKIFMKSFFIGQLSLLFYRKFKNYFS